MFFDGWRYKISRWSFTFFGLTFEMSFIFLHREKCLEDLCPVLTALWIIHSVFVATFFIPFVELPLTDLAVRSNAWRTSAVGKNTDETMRLQPKIGRFNIYFEKCQTCELGNAEKGHEWQELSQCSFHQHLVLNANAESFLGTWTNIIDLRWNLHFPVVLPTEIWPPHLFCC